MKYILSLFACLCMAGCAFGANPSFQSFDTNDFLILPSISTPNKIRLNGTLGVTNLYVTNITANYITVNGTNVAVINPTDGKYPYRSGTNSFGDGAITHIDPNTAGVDEMDIGTLVVTNLMTGGVVISDTSGTLTNIPAGSGVLLNDGANNFSWGAAGTTINPTNNFVPYRVNATTFEDSPLYRVDASTVAVQHDSTNSIELIGGNVGTLLLHAPVGSPAIIQSDDEIFYSLNGLGTQFRMGSLLFTPLSTSQASLGTSTFPWQWTYTDSIGWGGHTASFDSGAGVNPEGVVTADPGSIWRNTSAGTVWKKASGSGNTGWVELNSGAATVNPTDFYLPFRTNATTFFNSPLYVTSTNVALDSQLIFGPGTTNVLYRDGKALWATNGEPLLGVKYDTTKLGLQIVGGGAPHLYSTTDIFVDQRLVTLGLIPLNSSAYDIGQDASNGYYKDLWQNGKHYVTGFGYSGNYSRLAISHSGTNGVPLFDSQSAGTAGSPRPHTFALGATNQFSIGDGWIQLMRGMTKAEKATITATNGMVVYQTDNTPGLRAYVGGAWVMISTVADP